MDSVLRSVVLQRAIPGVDLAADAIGQHWSVLVRGGWFAAGALAILLLGWFVVVPAVASAVRRRNRNNPTIEEAISRYLQLLVALVAVYVGAASAGFTGVLTDSAIVIAAATLALGVAAQSVIGSLVSGTVLVLDPEFNVGDYVEWEEGEGTIRSITLRVTRVQTLDGELVTIPNDVLTRQAITRPFGHGRFQVVERVSLSYDDDLETALETLETAAVDFEESLDAPSPHVYVDEFASDAVVARVHFWIDDPDRRDVLEIRSRYARSVKRRLDAEGLTIAPASKRDLQGEVRVAESA